MLREPASLGTFTFLIITMGEVEHLVLRHWNFLFGKLLISSVLFYQVIDIFLADLQVLYIPGKDALF